MHKAHDSSDSEYPLSIFPILFTPAIGGDEGAVFILRPWFPFFLLSPSAPCFLRINLRWWHSRYMWVKNTFALGYPMLSMRFKVAAFLETFDCTEPTRLLSCTAALKSHCLEPRCIITALSSLEFLAPLTHVKFIRSRWTSRATCRVLQKEIYNFESLYKSSLSLFFPSFVRLIDVFNTLLVFSTLLSLL
jgi:hypothetical protein